MNCTSGRNFLLGFNFWTRLLADSATDNRMGFPHLVRVKESRQFLMLLAVSFSKQALGWNVGARGTCVR